MSKLKKKFTYLFLISVLVSVNANVFAQDFSLLPKAGKNRRDCSLLMKSFDTKYQGLIDNWVKDLGRKSQHINEKYLQEAIITYLKNDTIQINKTNAIGCIIERFK